MEFLNLVPGLHSRMADFHCAKERFLTPFQHPVATVRKKCMKQIDFQQYPRPCHISDPLSVDYEPALKHWNKLFPCHGS